MRLTKEELDKLENISKYSPIVITIAVDSYLEYFGQELMYKLEELFLIKDDDAWNEFDCWLIALLLTFDRKDFER